MKTNQNLRNAELHLLRCLSVVLLALGLAPNRAVAQGNVVQAGDAIVLHDGSNDGDPDAGPPPAGETVDHAIDRNTGKYLNFLDLGSGFIVTPTLGSSFAGTIVTGLRFYTADDAPERDPSSYLLEGSVNGVIGPWTVISGGGMQLPAERNPAGQLISSAMHFNLVVNFVNYTAFTTYRVTFPTLRDAAAANSMQIGEVELLGIVGTAPNIVFSEGFEFVFPNTWSVTNGNGDPTWRDVNSEFGGEGTHTGGWKAYCAGTAYPFGSTEPNPLYPNDMTASMSRSFNLSGYSAGQLTFWSKIPDIEFSYDWARVFVDADLVWSSTVPIANWTQAAISLNAYVGGVHTLTFEFQSDVSEMREGWYLDDIEIAGLLPNPPSITTQPQSQQAPCGSTVAFTVSATGTAPLSYQWQYNGTDLPGATQPTLSIGPVRPADAGSYRVRVSNGAANFTSAAVTLTVLPGPAPRLGITLVSSNVLIRWPMTCADLDLQETATLGSQMNWVPAIASVDLAGTDYVAIAPLQPTGNRFFRLAQRPVGAIPLQPPIVPLLELSESDLLPRGATGITDVAWREIPGSLTEELATQIRSAAQQSALVRSWLGDRFAYIDISMLEMPKGTNNSIPGPPLGPPNGPAVPYRVTFFSHSFNWAVLADMSGTTVVSVTNSTVLQPPEGADEVAAAVALARMDPRLAASVQGLIGRGLLVTVATPGQPGFGNRVIYVTFSRPDEAGPSYTAHVDLTLQTVISVATP